MLLTSFSIRFEDFANAKLGKPQVVVTGFGRHDTHELPNSLTWGPDGWLYGLNGVFNRSVIKQDGKTFDFTCALFRIHPKTKKFEIFCEGTSNPWGLAFNENGDAFVSACVIDHLWHLTETGYYERQGGPYPPYTWKIGSIVKHRHQKAAYCGLCWFDSDAYPPEYREKLYMGNIHGGCINCDQLEKDGSTYAAKPGLLPSPPVRRGRGAGGEGVQRPTFGIDIPRGTSSPSPLTPLPLSTGGEGKNLGVGPGGDFLVANDAWFMPVSQKVGPDGCMYILDWYDRYHCYQDAGRDPAGIDRLHGRLYRVVYKDYKPAGKFDLEEEVQDDEKLVKRLKSPNVYFRETMQRLLAQRLDDMRVFTKPPERGIHDRKRADECYKKLLKILHDEQEPLKIRLQAAWSLLGYMYPGDVAELMRDPNSSIRTWGMRSLLGSISTWNEASEEAYGPKSYRAIADLAKDKSPDVQLQIAIAARKLKGVDPLPVLLDVLTHCGDDKLIPHIVWQNLHPLLEKDGERFLTLAAKVDLAKSPGLAKVLPRAIDRILGNQNGDPAAVVKFIDKLSSDGKTVPAKLCLTALGVKIQNKEINGKQLDALNTQLKPGLKKMLDDKNLGVEAAILLTLMRDTDGKAAAHIIFGYTGKHSEATRIRAMNALIAAGDGPQVLYVAELFLRDKQGSVDFRGQMLAGFAALNDMAVAEQVLRYYPKMEPELQPKAIELLTQRPNWSKTLFKEIAAKKISKDAVNINQARRLLAMKDAELMKLVEAHWGTPRNSRDPERERVVAEMRELFKKTPGDAKAGVAVFKKVCAQCHKIYGEGVEVGPDITANGRSDFNQLLSNIFDPSLVIGAGYQAVTVSTKQGQSLTGLIVEDNQQRVVLKVQGGEIKTVARADVDEESTSKVSLMPEGLEKQLRPQEIVDLLAYLSLDRPPEDAKAKRIPGTPR